MATITTLTRLKQGKKQEKGCRMSELMEMELLRYVMEIKNDITEIKTSIKDFENRIDLFEGKIDVLNKKILDIETNLSINTLGVEEIEKREVLFRRIKRFVVDNVLSPFFNALQKGWFYLIVTALAILLTWLLILIGFDVENLRLREILR